jgi:hypothetical protein
MNGGRSLVYITTRECCREIAEESCGVERLRTKQRPTISVSEARAKHEMAFRILAISCVWAMKYLDDQLSFSNLCPQAIKRHP